MEVRRKGLRSMRRLLPRMQLAGYASAVLHPLIRVVDGPTVRDPILGQIILSFGRQAIAREVQRSMPHLRSPEHVYVLPTANSFMGKQLLRNRTSCGRKRWIRSAVWLWR